MTRPVKRTTILLADDHSIVIEGMRRLLEAEFDVIGVVSDGMTLIDVAEQLRPHVIVADVSMPVLNGIEAARQLRVNNPEIKIVFLSMHPDVVYVSEALRAGGSAYILKTSAGFEIVTAIREVIGGGIVVSPAIDPRALKAQLQRDQDSHDPLNTLPPRQREVLQMVAEGRSSKEIADILQISPRTAEFHRYRVMQSLGVRTIADLVRYAIKHGVVSPGAGIGAIRHPAQVPARSSSS